MMNKNEEISLVYNLLIHPAGFVLNVLEGEIQIRPIYNFSDIGWEMVWNEMIDGFAVEAFKIFTNPLEAATFYVEKRCELKIGMDMRNSCE